jgi:exodeoxyribonuclease V alpha subunit
MLIEQYNKNNQFLKKSKFRSSFKLDENDIKYISEKGIKAIQQHAHDFITQRLSLAFPEKDGKQTPYSGHPVFKAQHATGVCCRSCLEKWYKIPKGTELNENQVDDIVEIAITWIKEGYHLCASDPRPL